MTSEELVRRVDALQTPSPLERELANRLNTALEEIKELESQLPE